ncbi:MAG: FHA domain-containing protein [Archangium sp.]|nr:FHA domain-containing protein [Archangium sp.]MDP3154173.1 FHA domain-containing protein [Archangium sp.]MDP3569512.1 FHA domain-containing protein [Archangium sp.]
MGITTTSIEALKRLSTFPIDAMLQEVGPLALVQRLAAKDEQATLHKQLSRTIETEGRPQVARHALSLMLGLEDGLVVPLGRENPEGELVLGRGEEADVRLFDGSVSSKHARVRWDGWKRIAWLSDLGSTNGTLINGHQVTADEKELAEGNVVTLGDETAFLFLRTETLYALVRTR